MLPISQQAGLSKLDSFTCQKPAPGRHIVCILSNGRGAARAIHILQTENDMLREFRRDGDAAGIFGRVLAKLVKNSDLLCKRRVRVYVARAVVQRGKRCHRCGANAAAHLACGNLCHAATIDAKMRGNNVLLVATGQHALNNSDLLGV